MTSQPTATVIIPAHNEAALIERCLASILEHALPSEFEVIVACNACSDDTAERAAAFHPDVRVITTPIPSKFEAMAAADRVAQHFPRVYLDADAVIGTHALRRLVEITSTDERKAASPTCIFDDRRSSAAVRRYFRAFATLPVFNDAYVGGGVFALSAAAKEHLGEWPGDLPDDALVQRSFSPAERVQTADTFAVQAPLTARQLVARGVRIRRLNVALEHSRTDGGSTQAASIQHAMHLLGRRGSRLDALTLIVMNGYINLKAAAERHLAKELRWNRDDSTRREADLQLSAHDQHLRG
jgi:hypothetical protein